MSIYISFLLSRKDTSIINNLFYFSLNFVFSFLIKKLFLRARALVFRRFRDSFAAHYQNQLVVVSWEMSAIKFSYQCIRGVFFLRIAFVRFNPG